MLIEYVPYGDLLGYLRKSRGLNDTYYKDPDIKPKTSLTSHQLMKFAWQIADGMSYLSSKRVSTAFKGALSWGFLALTFSLRGHFGFITEFSPYAFRVVSSSSRQIQNPLWWTIVRHIGTCS